MFLVNQQPEMSELSDAWLSQGNYWLDLQYCELLYWGA